MQQPTGRPFKSLLAACALAGCVLYAAAAPARQEPAQQQRPDEEEVVRIETELIQTGVTVLDKAGKFVDGLRQEDFELTVEGKPVPLSFFERVAGAPAATPPASSSSSHAPKGATTEAPPTAAGGARTVVFFADDLHLSFDSRRRTRDLIQHFIDSEMTDEDTAAVVSSSGRVGFLQQFTDDPAVLRAAAERIGDDKNREATDRLIPPMSEYEALLISRYDPDVTEDFVRQTLELGQGVRKEDAEELVRSRANTILHTAAELSRRTYKALEQAVRRSAQMPGRKVFLLVSDGFLLDTSNSDSSERLRHIYDAAARAGAVVYTFDVRGLDASLPSNTPNHAVLDASPPPVSAARYAYRVKSGERFETQDPLDAIAEGTGGRFTKNTNDLRPGLSQALAEASRYYLLAWRPDPELRGKEGFRRVEVKVKGRPELTVRLQSGYLDDAAKGTAAAKVEPKNLKVGGTAAPPPDPAQEELRAGLNSIAPKTNLPTALALNYYEGPGGAVLAASVRVNGSAVSLTNEGGELKADVDLVGIVYDSKGKAEASFSKRLSLTAPAANIASGQAPDLFYNHETMLAPGLHQMRVAARDVKTGRLGSAAQWVEVPDLSKHKLALSSLLLAETRAGGAGPEKSPEPAAAEMSVDRRFERTSALRYLVFVYNARGNGAAEPPDVTAETQVFRANRPVLTAPPARVPPEGQDAARLAYAAEVPLRGLPPGRYSLRVTVRDRAAQATAERRVSFTIK